MKRLCIYFFYDKDGIVDDYVPYFLSAMKPLCEEVCVVVNGDLDSEGHKKLKDCSDKLLLRENIGFDSWAYKHALEYYGFDKIKEFNELIMCNFTFFGPIFPLSEMFDKMEASKCDFWGIHKHPAIEAYMGETKITEHIQSHFIVFRKSILKDASFKEYWDTLKPVNNYNEAVGFHELRCTEYFEERGFISDCYIDKDKYFKLINSNASIFLAGKQIREDRCPILKRKVFSFRHKHLEHLQADNDDLVELLKYIKDNSSYPLEMITTNISRCFIQEAKLRKLVVQEKFFQLFSYVSRWSASYEKIRKRFRMYNSTVRLLRYIRTIKQ